MITECSNYIGKDIDFLCFLVVLTNDLHDEFSDRNSPCV